MSRAHARNALRLVDADGPPRNPSGMILSRRDAVAIAARLARRAQHYGSLRVTAFGERLVLWSVADDVRLPWVDGGVTYLAHMDKAIFFPVDKRPDIPARWMDALVGRLAAEKRLSRPLLLYPSPDGLTALGLGRNSCQFPAVDWEGLAAP